MLLGLAAGWPNEARPQLLLLPDSEPPGVFGGGPRKFTVRWRNDSDQIAAADIHAQLYQASSATAASVGQIAMKRLQILPHQTIIESATIEFPLVKAKTRFLIQWLDATNRVLGLSDVNIYPTNLLEGLRPLTGRKPLGVFDPQNQIKPLLLAADVEFEDLPKENVLHFAGRLAIIGPFPAGNSDSEWVGKGVADLAHAGVAVVWIKPESTSDPAPEPAVYPVRFGSGTVTVVRPRVVSNLAEDPRAQLNLIRSAQLASRPDLLSLSTSQP
ncbi:MAG: hypothetical protein JWR69_4282 [Pedosphaera sp.]|nr:hypothetical protein [Pedosphaera sp.]